MNHGTHLAPAPTIGRPMRIPGDERRMAIGEVTARAGVSERLVRHCEARGLLSHADEDGADSRRYTHEDIGVLRFVRQAHVLGFGMNEAAQLLCAWQDMRRAGAQPAGITAAGAMRPDPCLDACRPGGDIVERLANAIPVELQPVCSILEEILELGQGMRLRESRA